jgi:hypothetical protein
VAAGAARQRRWQRGGSVGCAMAASAERRRQRGSGAATVGSSAAASAARGRRRQRSGGVGCGARSWAVAGNGAAGRRQRRRQSGGGGGSTALAATRWQRRKRRQPNHPCHGAADSAINCRRTAWRRSSVPLRTMMWMEVNWQLLFFVKWLYKFVKLDKPSSIAAIAMNRKFW